MVRKSEMGHDILNWLVYYLSICVVINYIKTKEVRALVFGVLRLPIPNALSNAANALHQTATTATATQDCQDYK